MPNKLPFSSFIRLKSLVQCWTKQECKSLKTHEKADLVSRRFLKIANPSFQSKIANSYLLACYWVKSKKVASELYTEHVLQTRSRLIKYVKVLKGFQRTPTEI